ncbi:hypothetical protein SLA2020_402580 [Shorea laevis]
MDSETVVHSGGCHCRNVRWQVRAPTSVVASDCNCSDCFMRANTHFIVPAERFELLGDSRTVSYNLHLWHSYSKAHILLASLSKGQNQPTEGPK